MKLKEFKLQPLTFKSKPLTCTGPFHGSGRGPPMYSHGYMCVLFCFLKYILLIILQRRRERDRELETSMREKHRSAASRTLPTGDVPATKGHALDRNQTWDPSVRRPMLYPLSQTGQGYMCVFLIKIPK
uniref:Uncharacterized protein n=1 Tax=Myotis myotis TaxID=51298 RepID=A0A7J7RUS5_MYOMY|nr:hypothetical protein mMyoMyo1_010155 [Myotis myotis]